MSEGLSSKITGYISNDIMWMRYEDYYGSISIADDVKYYTSNLSNIIEYLNTLPINLDLANGKLSIDCKIPYGFQTKNIKVDLSNRPYLNEIIISQKKRDILFIR